MDAYRIYMDIYMYPDAYGYLSTNIKLTLVPVAVSFPC